MQQTSNTAYIIMRCVQLLTVANTSLMVSARLVSRAPLMMPTILSQSSGIKHTDTSEEHERRRGLHDITAQIT